MADRPTEYSDEVADLICGLLAEGKSLRSILALDGMPNARYVYQWMREHPEFGKQYARAREDQADCLADEIQDIADEDPTIAFTQLVRNGTEFDVAKVDSAVEQWRKTRIDARKWIAAKLKPKKYGEKVAAELSGPGGKELTLAAAAPVINFALTMTSPKEGK